MEWTSSDLAGKAGRRTDELCHRIRRTDICWTHNSQACSSVWFPPMSAWSDGQTKEYISMWQADNHYHYFLNSLGCPGKVKSVDLFAVDLSMFGNFQIPKSTDRQIDRFGLSVSRHNLSICRSVFVNFQIVQNGFRSSLTSGTIESTWKPRFICGGDIFGGHVEFDTLWCKMQ